MHKIIKIQLVLLFCLTLFFCIAKGSMEGAGFSIMILFGMVIGPVMAYTYPHGREGHIIITIGFTISGVLIFYGIKKRILTRGIVAFLLGFWLWAFIGLVAGLGTGT